MNIIYRQIEEGDKEGINNLYEKLLDRREGIGHRISKLVL